MNEDPIMKILILLGLLISAVLNIAYGIYLIRMKEYYSKKSKEEFIDSLKAIMPDETILNILIPEKTKKKKR